MPPEVLPHMLIAILVTCASDLTDGEVQLPCGGLHGHALTCLLTHEGTADGGLVGDLLLQGVCLVGSV